LREIQGGGEEEEEEEEKTFPVLLRKTYLFPINLIITNRTCEKISIVSVRLFLWK
jgi:hypothetical protein